MSVLRHCACRKLRERQHSHNLFDLSWNFDLCNCCRLDLGVATIVSLPRTLSAQVVFTALACSKRIFVFEP